MNSKHRLRTRAVYILILCAAGALGSSLYWTQVMNGRTYAAKADNQYVKPAISLFDRGTIFFQSNDGTKAAAATVGSGFLVYMNPALVTSASQAYDALSHYLAIDKADFMARATRKNDRYEEIVHHIDADKAGSIKALSIPGVSVVKETWRLYPGGTLSAHELGLVGENPFGAVDGRYGLERSYESVLARSGIGSKANVFAQLFSGVRDTVFGGASAEGDIVTTIEPTVERYLQKELQATLDHWHPDEIGGIIIDPKTGEIIAMDSLPTFDPNNTGAAKNVKVFSDPLVENVYEMGSILKPLTMATALDTGAVTPTSTYDDTGTMTLNSKKISNYDGKARGVIPMQEILSQSLNVGAATIALKVGKENFASYFQKFGLGDKTGIDLPNEATGIIGNLKTGRDVEIATAAYGQGIAMSPVNTARALSILANGGHVVTPHLVKQVDMSDGTTKAIPKDIGPSVLKKETVDEVTHMLVTVVDKALHKSAIKIDDDSVAAKTGTAQIASSPPLLAV